MQVRKPLADLAPGDHVVSVLRRDRKPFEVGSAFTGTEDIEAGQTYTGTRGGRYVMTRDSRAFRFANGQKLLIVRGIPGRMDDTAELITAVIEAEDL